MTTTTVSGLRENLDRFLSRIDKGPVVVTRRGKPVALLVAPDEDTLYELKLLNSPRFLEILASAQRQIEAGQYQTIEEFRKKHRIRKGKLAPHGRRRSAGSNNHE